MAAAYNFRLLFLDGRAADGVTPRRRDGEIDAIGGGGLDHEVHVIPIVVLRGVGGIAAGRDVQFGDVAVHDGAVVIHGFVREHLDDDRLHDVEAFGLAVGEVGFDLVAVEFLDEQPAGVAEPEERLAVGVLEIAAVLRDGELSVVPGVLAHGRLGQNQQGEQ